MKYTFFKIIFIITFIFNLFLPAVSNETLGITSAVYDNSGAVLTINSNDNLEYAFDSKPQIHVVPEEKKAYFDISPAILKCPSQNFVIKSSILNEIVISQFSLNPNIVRVVFYYNDNFNPYNVQLKKLNNSLFLKLSNPVSSNYYFQNLYQESSVQEFFEPSVIQIKLKNKLNNVLSEINSSFGNSVPADNEFILADKISLLRSKYYVNNISFKNNQPIISGIGSYTYTKPFYLSGPSRAVFDIKNAVVNPAIRNKEFIFNNTESVKIGQFDKSTARVVLNSSSPEKYLPVIFPDSQRLAFSDIGNLPNLYSQVANLSSVKYENSDNSVQGLKFIFDKPIVWGVTRRSGKINLYFYNLEKYDLNSILNELKNSSFLDYKITGLSARGVTLAINDSNIQNISIMAGVDGKTLRIKAKFDGSNVSNKHISEVVNVQPVVPSKIVGKKYVVIDAGHGGSDVGATRNDIYEKDITLDVSKRVEKLLIKKGYVVQMTRNDDSTVTLQERVDFCENVNPDIFVSIHVNSSNSDTPYGIETHYYKDNSLNLAKFVHASMLNHISSNNRGLFKSKFYVINHTIAPAILVEIGFISNPDERAQLLSDSRKDATAAAIAEGIDEYFKQ